MQPGGNIRRPVRVIAHLCSLIGKSDSTTASPPTTAATTLVLPVVVAGIIVVVQT